MSKNRHMGWSSHYRYFGARMVRAPTVGEPRAGNRGTCLTERETVELPQLKKKGENGETQIWCQSKNYIVRVMIR
jgi:hypothetical protein